MVGAEVNGGDGGWSVVGRQGVLTMSVGRRQRRRERPRPRSPPVLFISLVFFAMCSWVLLSGTTTAGINSGESLVLLA
ncbi:hypothetical protein Hdeb2414_s0012g00386121 [Helianthus debilis subsp. tardiflorus]